ncbi:hypothetical protein BO94DRAFT_591362 [Aspergillus sclerotioniger CBS 115572]|uniref:Uncharacterized protein n=1 Tax=Aspergillus sclerotioniger CBS 115572 TaxID=1450535 RepID=A0A317UUA7_9EURO|nr:hypothetical protein BO94DRAFT_591362 [Aspergillus sclerotioniger CBS 115572]PWY65633.1 hypothetical protein BO94DRAFT_591362 [Aspergillus sclerotioniger CBS 115572]
MNIPEELNDASVGSQLRAWYSVEQNDTFAEFVDWLGDKYHECSERGEYIDIEASQSNTPRELNKTNIGSQINAWLNARVVQRREMFLQFATWFASIYNFKLKIKTPQELNEVNVGFQISASLDARAEQYDTFNEFANWIASKYNEASGRGKNMDGEARDYGELIEGVERAKLPKLVDLVSGKVRAGVLSSYLSIEDEIEEAPWAESWTINKSLVNFKGPPWPVYINSPLMSYRLDDESKGDDWRLKLSSVTERIPEICDVSNSKSNEWNIFVAPSQGWDCRSIRAIRLTVVHFHRQLAYLLQTHIMEESFRPGVVGGFPEYDPPKAFRAVYLREFHNDFYLGFNNLHRYMLTLRIFDHGDGAFEEIYLWTQLLSRLMEASLAVSPEKLKEYKRSREGLIQFLLENSRCCGSDDIIEAIAEMTVEEGEVEED